MNAEMRSGRTGLAWTSVILTFVRVVVFCSQDTAVDSVIGSEHREQFALLIQTFPWHQSDEGDWYV